MNERTNTPFRHEQLRIYPFALEFLRTAQTLRDRLPRGHAPIGDQLTRAATSVVLNIAEGIAQEGGNVKRHLTIARGSAAECAAALDVLSALKLIDEKRYTAARQTMLSLGRMLSALRLKCRANSR